MKCLYCTQYFKTYVDYYNHYIDNYILYNARCYNCASCNLAFITSAELLTHINYAHNFQLSESTLFKPERWGFKNLLVELIHVNERNIVDPEKFV